jgi:tRNA uridine 5-carboxymethylaminomethyl modification enzyme
MGLAAGCVGSERAACFAAKSKALADGEALLKSLTLTPDEAGKRGLVVNRDGRKRSAYELLAYPDINLATLAGVWPEIGNLDGKIAAQLAVDARYAVYLKRQELDIAAFRKEESVVIPHDFAFEGIGGLSTELRQKLERDRPASLGQAARLDGMTPAALLLLLAHLKKGSRWKTA